jgi:hypothetical protein
MTANMLNVLCRTITCQMIDNGPVRWTDCNSGLRF